MGEEMEAKEHTGRDVATAPAVRLIATLRNNRVLLLRERAGATQEALARAVGIPHAHLCAIEKFGRSGLKGRGISLQALAGSVRRLADYFGVEADTIAPAGIFEALKVSRIEKEMDADDALVPFSSPEVRQLECQTEGMEAAIEHRRRLENLPADLQAALTPREEQILRMQFGIGAGEGEGATLAEISDRFECSRARISQISQKALRKLRRHLIDPADAEARARELARRFEQDWSPESMVPVDRLTYREAEIIRLRFGSGDGRLTPREDGKPNTLSAWRVGEMLGLHMKDVQRIELAALDKLERHARKEHRRQRRL